MTPFVPAFVPQSEQVGMYETIYAKWQAGDPEMRQAFPATNEAEARSQIKAALRVLVADKVYRNDTYQVTVREIDNGVVMLSIKRIDREIIHDWRELQQIKNQLLGEECEAVELYPAESRRVDTANQYYLFGSKNPAWRFPFGFDSGRHVTDTNLGKSVNRPFS